MIDLAIIIINYRTPVMTAECLESVLPEIKNISSRIIVVDNDSGDNSIEYLETWCGKNDHDSNITIIGSEHNLGFSGGNNLGINSVDAKYYLLLNSDTLLNKDSIISLISYANNNPETGLITPRLENIDGSAQECCFQYITPMSEFLSAARTGFIYRLFSRYVIPVPVVDAITSPQWSSFACVLIRKQVFDKIGLLDDGFFMYFEDTEFCYRARKAKWDIINLPASRVIHLGGMSSTLADDVKSNNRPPRYLYESRARYFYLLYGRAGLLAANILWHLGRIISKTIQVLGRSNKATPSMQWHDIWINFLDPLHNKRTR